MIVPLNSLIQYLAPPKRIGTILAGNNFIQNVTMILFLVATILLVQTGFSSYGIFNTAALITLIGSLYAFSEIAQLAARVVLIPILKTRYRLFVEGLENLPQRGGVLLLGNHISWIDWLILQVASPRPLKFVMERSIYEQWYLKWFLKRFDVIPISGVASKGALEAVRERLLKGEAVSLFPEGRISYNGQLGEFKKGFELILKDVDVPVVPFYLHGLWGSTFSRACSGYKLITRSGPRREVGVVFGRPLKSNADRVAVKQAVQSLSFKAWDRSVSSMKPLHFHWLRRCKEAPFKRALADDTGSDMNRLKMLTSVLLFSKLLKNSLGKSRNIGVLLPSSAAGAIANMTLLAMGKRVVNLNYTIDPKALKYAMQKADIEYVVTSERFLKRLEKRGFNPLEGESGVKPILMEELAKQIRPVQKALTLAAALLLPKALLEALYFEKCRLNDTAAILFSSGSEGVPKGIELTHKNLLGNIKQVSAMLNFCDEDVILNSLPIFHSFGLTVTTLLPLCEGVEMVSVADPTDALAVGKSAARYRATIIFGTATFFRIYTKNRKLHPLMFSSVRMAVAGAEKLKPQIRKDFKAKFGIDLFEGYGTTETSPVVSVNMPDMLDPDTLKLIIGHKEGSVGQPLPGTLIKIV
ncbi:MAG: AMP-binding protein, partial [Hydrogenimonas sp.]|nr:AMP-binding protein [Hydrogenimonas sp.]